MRLVVRILGIEVLAIEQDDDAEPWDSGVTSSVGFTVDPLPEREDWSEGE